MVVALAGRRIDPPNADVPRFPLKNKALVKERIRLFFREHQVSVLCCSASCGADLLALEACFEAAIPYWIVLPFDPQTFKKKSVTDRPGNWVSIYNKVIKEAKEKERLIILGLESSIEDSFKKVNEMMLAQAKWLHSTISNGENGLAALVIWEGHAKSQGDFTEHFRTIAQKEGFSVSFIDTLGP